MRTKYATEAISSCPNQLFLFTMDWVGMTPETETTVVSGKIQGGAIKTFPLPRRVILSFGFIRL